MADGSELRNDCTESFLDAKRGLFRPCSPLRKYEPFALAKSRIDWLIAFDGKGQSPSHGKRFFRSVTFGYSGFGFDFPSYVLNASTCWL